MATITDYMQRKFKVLAACMLALLLLAVPAALFAHTEDAAHQAGVEGFSYAVHGVDHQHPLEQRCRAAVQPGDHQTRPVQR